MNAHGQACTASSKDVGGFWLSMIVTHPLDYKKSMSLQTPAHVLPSNRSCVYASPLAPGLSALLASLPQLLPVGPTQLMGV